MFKRDVRREGLAERLAKRETRWVKADELHADKSSNAAAYGNIFKGAFSA
jgi:hypothetical protein